MIDEIFRDKVRRALEESPERKFVSGLTLFETALVRMRGGVRVQHPDFTPEQVESELCRQIARVRQVHEYGFYSAMPLS